MMKKIILIISLALFSLSAMAQEQSHFEGNNQIIKEFFNKYQDLEAITKIEIGPAMVRILATQLFTGGDDSSAQLLRSIRSIDILVESEEGKSHIREAMFKLPEQCEGFEMITAVNDSGELSKFYFAQHEDDKMCEFLMLVRQFDQRVVLYITGEFSVSDISALSSIGSSISN